MGMGDNAAGLDEILKLVSLVCTQDSVKNLLRKAKATGGDKSPVRISGTFDTLVSEHLRNALQLNAVSRGAVYDLIRESEESGKQHIFYYKSRDEDVLTHCNNGLNIAERLFGTGWQTSRGFPNYHYLTSGMEWTDFRLMPNVETGTSDWVAKLYAGVIKERHVDTTREDLPGPDGRSRITKVYEEYPSREVYLVRWHHFGLLELRVPLEKSHKNLLASVRGLWNAIEPAVNSEAFEPFDLLPACRRIIDLHADHTTSFRLGDTHLLDPQGGSARISPRSGEEHLMDDDVRRSAIELFDQCRLLVVIWLLDEARHDTTDELRSVIGRIRPNELVMASRTTAKALTHVTNQLHRFAS